MFDKDFSILLDKAQNNNERYEILSGLKDYAIPNYNDGGLSRSWPWINESHDGAVIRLGCVWDRASAYRATSESGRDGSDRGRGEVNAVVSGSD